MKNCFFNNWYCISQIHDLKPIIRRSFRQPALPKRDSAFEEKTRIVSSREIWGSFQNRFFSYHQRNKPSRAQKKHFWNVLNVVLEGFYFAQETKAVFISIRYPKTSQTQDVKSQSTKRSLRSLAQPKLDSAFEQKTRIVPSREIWGSSRNNFLERNQRLFGNFVFCFRWNWPIFFGRFVRNSSKQLHTIQNDGDTFPKKSKAVFLSIRYRKTSQTQDVKSQSTKRSVRKLAQPKRDSAFEPETRIVSSGEIWGSSQNSFFSYNQSNKPTRAQKDIFGTYSTSFWKGSVLLKKQELFL